MNQTTRWVLADKAEAEDKRGGAAPVNGAPDKDGEIDWAMVSRAAIIAIAVVVTVTALGYGRSFFMPVLAGIIIGITLSPVQKWAGQFGVPAPLTAILLVIVFLLLAWLLISLVVGAAAEWIARAPEIGDTVKEKLAYLERPVATLRELIDAMRGGGAGDGQKVSVEASLADIAQQAVAVLRPALTEFLVFFGTLLFFLAGVTKLRRTLIVRFGSRRARLRVVRIWGDVEHNLIAYLGTVTAINLGLGTVTAGMLYLFGFNNPIALGALAFMLNYIPYIGPALFAGLLLVVGFVTSPTLGAALAPAVIFVGFNVVEGNFLTPSIIGRRLTLSPFFVFVGLAFWTWLWGPLGAFLATPLLIVALVLLNHSFPRNEAALPK